VAFNAALKRRSSTVYQRYRSGLDCQEESRFLLLVGMTRPGTKIEIKTKINTKIKINFRIKINSKGGGQECPPHTSTPQRLKPHFTPTAWRHD